MALAADERSASNGVLILKSWSLMETAISVVGLACVLLLNLIL